MPEEEKKDVPMVDIDSSGPDAEVELQDEANESEAVESTENTSTEAVAAEPQAASDEQQETEKDNKKDELENYSKDVQRRIAKLTKKWRDAERQRDEALTFAQLQRKRAEEMNKKYSTLESTSVKDRQEKIQSLLDAQKAKLAQARDAQDTNAEVEINKTIAQLGYEEARIQELLKAAESQPQRQETVEQADYTPRPEPRVSVDPKAEAWASQNKWFGADKAMTYTAFDLHKQLVDDEGYDPKSDEYYEEIDKRLRLEFPHKFGTNDETKGETTKPVQTVASATRSTKSGRKTVRLTPTEVAIAKKLGVSLEDYAKQKKLMKEV
jgi:hypothetical protein